MRKKRLILILLVLICLFNLVGCATNNPEGWESTPRRAPLQPIYRQVTLSEKNQHCGYNTMACAVYRISIGICWIYCTDAQEDMPKWLKDHEEKHCEGYDHSAAIAPIRFIH